MEDTPLDTPGELDCSVTVYDGSLHDMRYD